ncbi:MAG: slipin family protein [Saprospiraceae bacterium]|jgi:regulator of protease activity HflC (stomatin/prohibitin superfamily)|nr:slipin family protein [Saprospiraceae bacterium]
MKKVVVNTNCIGLIFKNRELNQVLNQGIYWLMPWTEVSIYDMAKPFPMDINAEVLRLNKEFEAKTILIDVAGNQLVFVYKDKVIHRMLSAGKYCFWNNGINKFEFQNADTSKIMIESELDKKMLMNICGSYIRAYKIESFEKGILFVDGEMKQTLDAGTYMYWKNAIDISVLKTDMRLINMEIPGQEILTKDKAQLRLNFTLQYKVTDIIKALVENKEFEKQLYVIMQLAIREYVGKLTFDELMETKENLSEFVLNDVIAKATELGVEVKSCGLKDIILPGDIRDIMNQVLIAEKRAQANIITRREETASTRSLLNTAKLMEDNAMLFKLKEMEYVEKIADKISHITLSGSGQIVDQLKQIFVK